MDKKEYLKNCKLFHGETEYPAIKLENVDLAFSIWEAEEFGYRSIDTDTESQIIKNWRDADLPACATNLHPYLLASLFAVYSKHSDLPLNEVSKNFERFYVPRYMALTVM